MEQKKSRAIQRADRIREMVPIAQVLSDYGYSVRPDGDLREQQFSCNLHGDGWDTKPSARVYPESNSWYCFACDISRDPIATVRANEDLAFYPAVRLLEKAFSLPPLPWSDEDDDSYRGPSTRAVIESNLRVGKTFDDDVRRFHALLDGAVQERDVSLEIATSYWEAFDKVCLQVRGPRGKGGPWDMKTGRVVLEELRQRLMDAL